ncbi:DMT family transporter [Albidovulum inexpectatum]
MPPLLLAERLSLQRMAAVGLGFCGILIVARPFGAQSVPIGLIAALGCAVAFALTAIATKRLTRVASVGCILFWLALMQSLLGLAFAGIDGRIALPHGKVALWVLVMGLAGLMAHFSLTKALSLAPATIVTPMDFLRLPVIALIGALLYAEPLDPWVLLGGAVILTANWINLRA